MAKSDHNLRFITFLINSSLFIACGVPKANYMIAHPEKYDDETLYAYARHICRVLRRKSLTRTKFYGLENIPKEGAHVLYANHQGKYDALAIYQALERPTTVLWDVRSAKRMLTRQVSGLVKAVIIDNEDPRDSVRAINEAIDVVNGGKPCIVFPEGGYDNNHNVLQEFKTGCFSISLKTKTPIVPVVLYDTYRSMNSNWLFPVTNSVYFLEPIMPEEYEGMKKKELSDLVKSRIQTKMTELLKKRYRME